MNADYQKKIDEALQLLKSIERAESIVFRESINKRIVFDAIRGTRNNISNATVSNINQSIGGTDAFTSPKQFDKMGIITIDGTNYYVGLYNV